MRKLIAIAVAGAFVAPLQAAELSLSGDMEYQLQATGENQKFATGDADFKVSVSEQLTDELKLSYFGEATKNFSGGSSAVTLSGAFGSFKIGSDVGDAHDDYDAKGDVAEAGSAYAAGNGNAGKTGGVSYTGAAGPIGFTVAYTVADSVPKVDAVPAVAAVAIDATDAAGNAHTGTDAILRGDKITALTIAKAEVPAKESTEALSIGLSYQMGPISLGYGFVDIENDSDDPNILSASGTMGPIYVGVDYVNNQSGDATASLNQVGATYDYGNGKLFLQQTKATKGATPVDTNTTVAGVSYKIGAMNTYISNASTDGSGDDTTYVGVEYSF